MVKSPSRFAIAGPSGSGKSTLARLLVANTRGSVLVQEPEPPPEICVASHVPPESAQRFQEVISHTRQLQAASFSDVRLLIFDRTFEEDREVFLRLYEVLGYLSRAQVDNLRRLSEECESSVGPPHCGIILTARPDVLRHRVLTDHQKRPQWLLDNLDLAYMFYMDWAETAKSRFLIKDTSELSTPAVAAIVQPYIDQMLDGRVSA